MYFAANSPKIDFPCNCKQIFNLVCLSSLKFRLEQYIGVGMVSCFVPTGRNCACVTLTMIIRGDHIRFKVFSSLILPRRSDIINHPVKCPSRLGARPPTHPPQAPNHTSQPAVFCLEEEVEDTQPAYQPATVTTHLCARFCAVRVCV